MIATMMKNYYSLSISYFDEKSDLKLNLDCLP